MEGESVRRRRVSGRNIIIAIIALPSPSPSHRASAPGEGIVGVRGQMGMIIPRPGDQTTRSDQRPRRAGGDQTSSRPGGGQTTRGPDDQTSKGRADEQTTRRPGEQTSRRAEGGQTTRRPDGKTTRRPDLASIQKAVPKVITPACPLCGGAPYIGGIARSFLARGSATSPAACRLMSFRPSMHYQFLPEFSRSKGTYK